MPNKVSIPVSAPGAKQAATEVDHLRERFDKLQQQSAKGLAIGAGAKITEMGIGLVKRAVYGLGDAIGDSIQAASDLNEQMTKSERVFGDASGAMDAFASKAAVSLGLSKRAALEAAGTFGQFFEGAGQSAKAAEQMSERIVTLGADLASFNNLDPGEALDKLRSGLAGEAEPLRSVGVFLTEAAVKAKAMKMGLGNAHGELTEGEKILARYELILEQTTKAQGDFARTSDGLANQQRRNNALLENAQARIGDPLQNLATAGASAAAELLDEEYRTSEKLIAARRVMAGLSDDELKAQLASAAQYATEANNVNLVAAATENAARNASHASDELIGVRQAVKDAIEPTDKLGATMRRLSGNLAAVAGDAATAATRLDEVMFGSAIDAGREQEIKDSITDLKKQRSEVEKGTPKWIVLNGKIAEQEQALFDLHLEMAQKEGPAALRKFLDEEAAKFAKSNVQILKQINLLKIANGLWGISSEGLGRVGTGTRYGGKIVPEYASGGIVKAQPGGSIVKVGEGGKDEAIIPLNRDGSMPASGGGSTVININVSGVSVLTPGSAEALARQLVPVITREQQRQGLIPRTR